MNMKRMHSSAGRTALGLATGDWRLATTRSAFTLVEMMLVLGLLALLAYFTGMSLRGPLERSSLPESGRRLRSLIQLTRANAMLDGQRYRIRMLAEGEDVADGFTPQERLQPFVERERDPVLEPGVFTPVRASWA